MEKPNLDRMWETWIRIDKIDTLTMQDSIRNKIDPMVSGLKNRNVINWYEFAQHPNPNDPNPKSRNKYFHVKFSVLDHIKTVDDMGLPSYCLYTKKVDNPLIISKKMITGIDKTLIINDEIEEAWKLNGEQSEWIIDLVRAHKGAMPVGQFVQFMHYFMNMMRLAKDQCAPDDWSKYF